MSTKEHIQWLENLLEEARDRFQKAQNEYHRAGREMKIAQEEMNALARTAQLAREKYEDSGEAHEDQIPESSEPETIPDIAEMILRKTGAMTTRELTDSINEFRGANSSLNTIFVSLNRQKPHRFDRKEDDKWILSKARSNGNHG